MRRHTPRLQHLPILPSSLLHPPLTPGLLPLPSAAGGDFEGQEDARYVGCFSSETMFVGREYTGGASGSQYSLIRYEAATKKRRYGLTYDIIGSWMETMSVSRHYTVGAFPADLVKALVGDFLADHHEGLWLCH